MRRSHKIPLFLGIALISAALLILSISVPTAFKNFDNIFKPSGTTLTITGLLINANTGEVVAVWNDSTSPLAILFGNTKIDVTDGSYELHFSPTWSITVSNISEQQYTVKVSVLNVTQKWKGTDLPDVTPLGVSNTAQATKDRTQTSVYLQAAKRIFGCSTVINNPPPIGASADYTITYNYKVELWSGPTLVDAKTGTATAKATFTNAVSGTLSSISVSVTTVQVFLPWQFGF